MWNDYVFARSLDDAARLLAQERERARVVAGGSDLLIEIERKTRRGVDTLIDLSRIGGLDQIRVDDDGDTVHLGPLTTHAQVSSSALLQQRALPLAHASWEVGAPQIRNRATVAGNLITASPANDTIAPLMALDAVVTLRSVRGERHVPLREFYTGVRRTVMQPDELLTDIAFRLLGPNEHGVFDKITLRRAQAISVVNAAVIVRLDGATMTEARIALGAVAPTIVRATEAEAFLAGQTLDDDTAEAAAQLAQKAAKPIDDVRASAEYRREMVAVLMRRTLRAIASGNTRGDLPERPVLLGKYAAPVARDSAPAEPIVTTINNKPYTLANAQDKTLLRLLREDVGLTGTKEGCAEGECGACTVFMDGAAVMSCLVPAPAAHGASITTIEGLAQDGVLHAVQQAFVDEAAVQCGYCTPGFLMSGAKLLEERPHPTHAEALEAISGNLCRCTGYYKILQAIEQAGKAHHE